ncbi:lysine--tRNA ligase [Peredibacter starrii]|uniref:Lysine--tRNA ligase n=1 Tax=Peredibacter starrii TaxID=28202 RepID=A0AAX4HN13_9BACT|nr:lysine--tRNA ligase [Peredibacter starrii]WPU64684.1 lysine--tRNA ligase [Peredibacter starrii]
MKDKHVRRWTELFPEQMEVRLEKRKKLEESGSNPYKNGYKPNTSFKYLTEQYGEKAKEEIGETPRYKVAGRVMMVRDFGKAAFLQVDDGSSRFQLYVNKQVTSEKGFAEYKLLDTGDIVYAEGDVFKTMKGELALNARELTILTKSIRPLPEKFHGLTDAELRYRMRYVDMIMDAEVRAKLKMRSQIVRYIREYFYENDFLEVETPMMHSVAGGAAARPFNTHHNALDMELFMRIAPELHLKRLIVGGYNKVFEMNRCFRNEGLSLKHNPEFTTIEFYWAYATYHDLMDFTEQLITGLATHVIKSDVVKFGEHEINLKGPYARLTMREAVAKYTNSTMDQVNDRTHLLGLLKGIDMDPKKLNSLSWGKLLVLAFEEKVEAKLIQPTFITEYPTEVSPLSRRNDENPEFVDRFEFFMNGWEVGNAFSELNNPTDQLDRFADQAMAKEAGDDEASEVDYDFVRALEYGMPPTAGQGIGIDRLVMILTDSPTIREVILFPLLKKEHFFSEEE